MCSLEEKAIENRGFTSGLIPPRITIPPLSSGISIRLCSLWMTHRYECSHSTNQGLHARTSWMAGTSCKDLGVRFPFDQPMKIYNSLWNADDWVTRGSLEKTDWSKAPFVTSYKGFHIDGCEASVEA